MAKRDKNYVSFWFWFLAIFVAAIPCIGWIMIIVWAFMGDNESRKNYFRAVIVWAVIFFCVWAAFFSLLGPELIRVLQELSHQARPA